MGNYFIKDVNRLLRDACYNGDIENVNSLLEKGADVNSGFLHACNCGNIEIVELMLHKGAYDLDKGIYNATLNNHDEIINVIEQKKVINHFHNLVWG